MGLGTTHLTTTKGMVQCLLKSWYNNKHLQFNAIILAKIILPTNQSQTNIQNCNSTIKSELTNPKYFLPTKIELLLGADLYKHIFSGTCYPMPKRYPISYSSFFEWILIETTQCHLSNVNYYIFVTSLSSSVDHLLTRF